LINNYTDKYIDEKDWQKGLRDSVDKLVDEEFSSYYSFGSNEKSNADKVILALSVANREGISFLSKEQLESITGINKIGNVLKKPIRLGSIIKDRSNKGHYSLRRGLFYLAVIFDQYSLYGIEVKESKFNEIANKIKEVVK
jgi:hypothetical protein